MAKPAAKKKRLTTPIADELMPTGSQEHYDHFLPDARDIQEPEILPLRADLALALSNARLGVEAVLAHTDRLEAELPGVSVTRIRTLPDLGLGVAFASGQVERYAAPPSGIRDWLRQAHELRAVLLSSADALAVSGILPAAALAKIDAGHGGIDTAGDCVALAALFQKHAAAIRGKTPISAAQVREAADVGSSLLGVLKPRRGKQQPRTELAATTEARDRLWTLFVRIWENDVWRAGAWLFGRDVDAHVPSLQARAGRRVARRGGRPPRARRAERRDKRRGGVGLAVRLPPTTPALHDAGHRPYFLWWNDVTVGEFRELVVDADPDTRAYWMGALLREANTRDVWLFVTPAQIRAEWPRLLRHLGRSRPMWAFLLGLEAEWPPAEARRAG